MPPPKLRTITTGLRILHACACGWMDVASITDEVGVIQRDVRRHLGGMVREGLIARRMYIFQGVGGWKWEYHLSEKGRTILRDKAAIAREFWGEVWEDTQSPIVDLDQEAHYGVGGNEHDTGIFGRTESETVSGAGPLPGERA